MTDKVWPVLSLDADGHEALLAVFTTEALALAYIASLPLPPDGYTYGLEVSYLNPDASPAATTNFAASHFLRDSRATMG